MGNGCIWIQRRWNGGTALLLSKENQLLWKFVRRIFERNVWVNMNNLVVKTPKGVKSLKIYVSKSQKKPSKGYHDFDFEVMET